MVANNKIKSVDKLIEHKLIDTHNLDALKQVEHNFTISINSHITKLIKQNKPGISKQFIPDLQELNFNKSELIDPIGDQTFSPVKGIVHRYPDRCLFKPINLCPVYCRFCFRREKVGPGNQALTAKELEACYNYLENHPEIWEVIITGGDPLILKPKILNKILLRLRSMKHIEIIRFHTRIPTIEPTRITDELINILKAYQPIYIILHANHPDEFTIDAITAINNLINHGIVMLSQSVLLKDINDNIETLSELMRCFIRNRIKPYYLHHGDLAKGTKHFRTSIKHGQQLMRQLHGRFSGLCQPTYVLDIPGGYGKSPIGPQYCNEQDYQYIIEDYNGLMHEYHDN